MGDELPPSQAMQPGQVADSVAHFKGRDTYVALCAGCHGIDGGGKPHIAPPMITNTSIRLSDPGNLLKVLVDGVPEQHYPNGEVMQEMPGYSDLLSTQELVDLTNYLRTEWGGRSSSITSRRR